MRLRVHSTMVVSGFAFFLCVILSSSSDAADTRSVLQMEQARKSWPLFAETKTEFTIEGRVRSRTNNQLTLTNSDLTCFLDPGITLPRPTGNLRVLKLKGKFLLKDREPIFQISSATQGTDEYQKYIEGRFAIREPDPAAWKELAEETALYAEFYDDPKLHEKAREAWLESITIERELAKQVTPAMMDAWIERLKNHKVPAESIDSWKHDRLWLKWKTAQGKQNRAELNQLAGDIANELPYARTTLETPQPKLLAAYRASPERLYADADEAQRKKLQRLLYREVLLAEILLQATEDGRNGDEIAKRLSESIPEEPELAEKYEQLVLRYRFNHLAEAGRDEALDLSREHRERGNTDRATETLKKWLEHRMNIWRKDGADGLIRGAREYVDLLEDKKQAFELLQEAWRLTGNNAELEKEFAALGYRLYQGRWITTREFAEIPPDELVEASKAGKVLPGMSTDLVVQAIGKPTQTLSSFSAGHVSQVWVYGETNGKMLTVHFSRSRESNKNSFRVVVIGEEK